VCRFHVAAGEKLHADKQLIWRPCSECHEASQHHLLKFGFLLLDRLNLGFTTEGRLAAVLIIPFSWGSQLVRHLYQHRTINKFSGAVAGEDEDFGKGSLSRTIFYFVFVLLYFIFSCNVLSKIEKN
jgi:hypothetical protein